MYVAWPARERISQDVGLVVVLIASGEEESHEVVVLLDVTEEVEELAAFEQLLLVAQLKLGPSGEFVPVPPAQVRRWSDVPESEIDVCRVLCQATWP